MPHTLYGWIWIFLIYSFLGWCIEVIFHAIRDRKFVNRGFLNGPWCPIYGLGMIILVLCLFPLRRNLIVLFLGSTILTTLLELVTGFILDKAFHSRWWDYSNQPLQLHGYICLQFSLCWGAAGTFIIAVVHGMIYHLMELLPFYIGHVLLIVFLIAFVLDCYITIRTLLKLTKRIRSLDNVSSALQRISDDIGENLFRNVESFSGMVSSVAMVLEQSPEETMLDVERKRELYQMRLDAIHAWAVPHKKAVETLRKNSSEAFSDSRFGERRLLKAFPKVQFNNHAESMQKYKEYLLHYKDRK